MKPQGGCRGWGEGLAKTAGGLVLSLLVSAVHAYPGGLDTTFGCATPPCTGIVQTGIPLPSGQAAGFGLALQSDGRLVVAGTTGSGSSANFALARYNANGTLDTTFNGNGTVTTAVSSGEDHGNAVALQTDGKIVVAGGSFISFVWNFSIARYNANGTLDGTFGTKMTTIGSTYNEAYAVAVDPAGNILMAGKAGDSPATDFAVLRYTAAGNLDPNFNGSGKVRTVMPFTCSGGCVGQAQAIALQADGKIVVGGWSGALGNADFILVRYNSNGTLDSSFGSSGVLRHAVSGGNDQLLALRIVTLPDTTQRILAVGTTSPSGNKASYALARYTMSGALDTAFGTNGVTTTSISGGNDVPASITIDAAGNIVIGGDENDVAGDFVVARYSSSGVLDRSFGCATAGTCQGYVLTNFGGTDQGKAVAVQADGAIVVAGVAAANTASAKFAVARYVTTGGGGGGGGPTATQLAVTSVNGGSAVTAGAGFGVGIQARDASGAPANVVAATQVSLALTAGTGPLNGTTSCTIAAGTNSCSASGLTLTTAQTGAVITASRVSGDTLSSGASNAFSVVSGPASNLQVFGFPSQVTAGAANSLTVKVRDQFNNTATTYSGAVHFTSTDGAAVLPADYTFVAGDAGQHVFSATMKSKGTWSISATDTGNASITGIETGIVVNPGAAASLTVVSGSGQNANVGTAYAFALAANLKDAYGNVIPGQAITFTGPGSGAGAVFSGGGTTVNATTDASGNASSGSFSANAVGGSYTVAATFGALAPAVFPLTNNKVASATSVSRTSGASPAAVNSTLTFTATVTGSAGTPSGSVSFVVDGVTTLCANVTLSGGQASCTTQALSGGSRLITAQYGGNGSYNGSTSSALSQSMTKTTPTVTITGSNPNPAAVNAAVTVSYTVVALPSGPVTPTGSVTVGDGTASCTGTVAAGQCAITFSSAGTKTLTASYAGDGSFNGATSPGFAQTVSGVTATVVIGVNPTVIAIGQTTTATATVSGSAGTPTGIVTVSGAGGSCAITLSGGTGTCVLTGNIVGASQTITGNYGGNATYGASSGTTALTVNKATPSVAMSVSPSTINVGQTTTVTATVSGGAGTPTGSVGVTGAGGACTVTLANGTGTCVLAGNTAGPSQTITGAYGGDARYVAASGTTTLTVNSSGSSATLTVTKGGSGSGTVTSSPAGITCGADCSETYAGPTSVTLTAAPAGGSIFTGWLGPCTGTGSCVTTVSGVVNVSATFAPSSISPPRVDVDGNGSYDALTDGLLVLRYLFGLSGTALIDGSVGTGATRTTAAQITAYLDNIRPLLDADGNNAVDALTDGVLFLRELFGLTGTALVDGAVGPGATRSTPTQIINYIRTLTP